MRRTLSDIWHDTPDDAARIVVVMFLMPFFFWLYQLAGGDQMAARAIFSGSLCALGWLIGVLIEERRPLIGFAVSTCAIAITVAAFGSLIMLDDPTWVWRTIMAGSQATIVAGWGILWRCRRRWLSHTLAGWSFAVASAGFVLYILVSFGIPDPLFADPGGWGFTQPKGIVRRVLDLPLDVGLGLCLWTALALTWRRWLLRHGK